MVSISFLRDVGIGALQQVESNRLAQNKRISEREKEERERKKRLAEIGLTGKLAMERQVLSSETSIEAANIRASASVKAANAKAKALLDKALLAKKEKLDDLGWERRFDEILPEFLQINSDNLNTFPKSGDQRGVYKISKLEGILKWDMARGEITDGKKTFYKNTVRNLIVEHSIFGKTTDITGNVSGGDYAFMNANPLLYALLKDTDLGPDLTGINPNTVPIKSETKAYFDKSLVGIYKDHSPGFLNAAYPAAVRLGLELEQLLTVSSEVIAPLEVRQNSVKNMKLGQYGSSFVYDRKKPRTFLAAVSLATKMAYGGGGPKVQIVGGRYHKGKHPNNEIYRNRIIEWRKKHSEHDNIFNDVLKVTELNLELVASGSPRIQIFRKLGIIISGPLIALKDQFLGKTISEKQLKELEGNNISGFDAKTLFEGMEESSKERLEVVRKSLYADKNINEEQRQERFAHEVQYEALKIQLVYKVAKMIQGGAGGQAVSNADFIAVLRSFQAGNLGTLLGQRSVFSLLQDMVEKEYLYSSIMSDENIKTGSHTIGRSAIDTLDEYRKEGETVRKGQTDSTEGMSLRDVAIRNETIANLMKNMKITKEEAIAEYNKILLESEKGASAAQSRGGI
jgi:hypothetical protein